MDPKDRPLPAQPIQDEAEPTTPPPVVVATTADPDNPTPRNPTGPNPLAKSHSSSSSISSSRTPSVGKDAARTHSPAPAPPTSILKPPSRYISPSPEPAGSHSRDSNYAALYGPGSTFSQSRTRHTSQSLSSFHTVGAGEGDFPKAEAHIASIANNSNADDGDDDDIYAQTPSHIKVEQHGPPSKRLTHPQSPLPPLPLSAFSVPQHPFGLPYSGFSSPTPMSPHFAPPPQLPPTSLPPLLRRETGDFSAGVGNNGYPANRTLDPTPYGSVAGLDPRSRNGARRLSRGPITALNADDYWHEQNTREVGRNRSLERRGSTLAVRAGTAMSLGRPITVFREDPDVDPDVTRTVTGTGTEVDWIVPVGEKTATVAVRLRPTLRTAIKEKKKASRKARVTGYLLNIAIGLQILLAALTTGLSVVIEGLKIATMTAILGGISTLVASYIARVRGSNEPEKSLMRAKDLDQFIREAELFNMDYGHLGSTSEEKEKYEESLTGFRVRLEEILGHGEGESHRSTTMFGSLLHGDQYPTLSSMSKPPVQPPNPATGEGHTEKT